ncbi:Gfo/Idh/MocA family oxidoreductase [Tunicatimonas pelagia]|uniref:Gfo/Idh/MocA family oxidoreductase n=1 Tax=Tunicatimonas pelagia TaxID=931531 RepID=UPI002665C8F3|nr:Gfo/Idh/MocA family oxidoreductase [Tunicatimonas pelagia]WKN44091.1 Gfo/Idh/MocA family oxidoreductase [Tunicatimonas pelagia]
MIQVALASYGMSGKVFHAPLIAAHPDFHLYKVLERHRNDAVADHPNVTTVRQFDDLLTDENIDLIVVNTPNTHHFSMTKAALEAGKHVVVEKPFTNTAAEAKELIALAKQRNQVLTVFQNRRLDSDFLTVQKVLQQQLCGRVVEYEAHYDRYRNYIQPDTWKEESGPGSGILYNLGSHMIDQALVLFGMPETLFAKLSIQRTGGKAPDAYHLILGYPDKQVTLKSSYLVRDEGPRYKILGDLGTFTKYGLDSQEDDLKAGKMPNEADWGTEPEAIWGTLDTELNGLPFRGKVTSEAGSYLAFYENLAQVVSGKASLLIPAEEAEQVIHLIELAYQSDESGRELNV